MIQGYHWQSIVSDASIDVSIVLISLITPISYHPYLLIILIISIVPSTI
jgi:hypothetical protein